MSVTLIARLLGVVGTFKFNMTTMRFVSFSLQWLSTTSQSQLTERCRKSPAMTAELSLSSSSWSWEASWICWFCHRAKALLCCVSQIKRLKSKSEFCSACFSLRHKSATSCLSFHPFSASCAIQARKIRPIIRIADFAFCFSLANPNTQTINH